MIRKEWLSNYHSREITEYNRFKKNRIKPEFSSIKYPDKSRFPKLSYPCASLGGSNIWSQIPLFGTSFVKIPPWPQNELQKILGFGSNQDFLDLMKLARMGKVYFLLTASPLEYENCDFLEDLLREFEPPFLYETGLIDVDGEDRKEYEEFLTAANHLFIPALRSIYHNRSQRYLQKRIDEYAMDYIVLKKLGYEEIIDEILKKMNEDFDIASAYFTVFGNLIAVPVLSPMKASYGIIHCDVKSFYEDSLRLLNPAIVENTSSRLGKIILPGEVGYFLMNKLTFLPESYEAVISLMDKYTQEDLYRVLNLLEDGFRQDNIDIIMSKNKEISIIFDNLWNDSKNIKRLSNGINYGISVAIGAIGALTTLPIGGIGFLTGLGFSVADKYLPLMSEQVSKAILPNHTRMMFDFKKKYNIPD